MAHIVSTATGFPPHYYLQEELVAGFHKIWSRRHINLNRLEKIHLNTTVRGRYLALPMEAYENLRGLGQRNDAWIESSLDLGEKILCDLFDRNHLDPQEIHLFASTTITGIAVPSLEARLMNRIPFSRDLKRMPLFGLGCLGGAAGIARIADYLTGFPKHAALLLSIELCTLTIQHDDISMANIISGGLFGDGGAAVLMVGEEHPLRRSSQPRVVASRSVFFPGTEYIMGWDVVDTGFKIVLSSDVTQIAEHHLRPGLVSFLDEHSLRIEDIDYWLAHPGGPKVMQALELGLGLKNDALALSRESLASVGNISSASVLLILNDFLGRERPPRGAYGLLMAMGPAFCAEMVLLQW